MTNVSPFDDLILELQQQLWTSVGPKGSQKRMDRHAFLIQQLGLLRTSYIYLVESGRNAAKTIGQTHGGPVSFEKAALEHPRTSREVFLNYYSFINILCQLSRVLPKHFSGAQSIPLYDRIRFYRNKVVEHWDEYTINIAQTGFIFQKEKASIPAIEAVHESQDRKKVFKQLKDSFRELGGHLKWDDAKIHNMIGVNAEYSEAIFRALEGIKRWVSMQAGKNKQYDALISLLIEFGFPTPIIDIEEYSADLVSHLKTVAKLE